MVNCYLYEFEFSKTHGFGCHKQLLCRAVCAKMLILKLFMPCVDDKWKPRNLWSLKHGVIWLIFYVACRLKQFDKLIHKMFWVISKFSWTLHSIENTTLKHTLCYKQFWILQIYISLFSLNEYHLIIWSTLISYECTITNSY